MENRKQKMSLELHENGKWKTGNVEEHTFDVMK